MELFPFVLSVAAESKHLFCFRFFPKETTGKDYEIPLTGEEGTANQKIIDTPKKSGT